MTTVSPSDKIDCIWWNNRGGTYIYIYIYTVLNPCTRRPDVCWAGIYIRYIYYPGYIIGRGAGRVAWWRQVWESESHGQRLMGRGGRTEKETGWERRCKIHRGGSCSSIKFLLQTVLQTRTATAGSECGQKNVSEK